MSTSKERVVKERAELGYKIGKLSNFLRKQKEKQTIPEKHLELLIEQFAIMKKYKFILDKRLEIWRKEE